MTLKEIADEWFDQTVPYPVPDPHKLQGQCVQFIRWCLDNYYHKPQWDAVVGAADFWRSYETDSRMRMHFKQITNTPIFIPKHGDIVIWNKNKGGGYGHIAIVYGDQQSLKMMTCLEQNWKPLKVSIVAHNYNDVLGFFRVKEEE